MKWTQSGEWHFIGRRHQHDCLLSSALNALLRRDAAIKVLPIRQHGGRSYEISDDDDEEEIERLDDCAVIGARIVFQSRGSKVWYDLILLADGPDGCVWNQQL